jgi:hypothetical protein
MRKLDGAGQKAERAGRRRLLPACAVPLRDIIADARRRAECLLETP